VVSPSEHDTLNAICPVSRETFGRLGAYVALLQKWSRSINLVAPSTLPEVWTRHVADSLQLYALNPGPQHWVDLGSGGGLPGIVTAIMLTETGGGRVDMVESNQKKAAFLRQAIAGTGARGAVHAVRIEQARGKVGTCHSVSARALADLPTLLDLGSSWLLDGATGWFQKGRDYRIEIDNARRSWRFDLVEHASMVEKDSVILEISNLQPIIA